MVKTIQRQDVSNVTAAENLMKKLFVLDTNVIMHDWESFLNFQEHDVAVPITVLEELDKFKKGDEDRNVQARRFLRRIDEFTGDALTESGASLGEGRGCIRIVLAGKLKKKIGDVFLMDTADHRILNAVLRLQEQHPEQKVILVSKDTNLRLKARGLNVTAQDYTTDKIESFEKLYSGNRVISAGSELIDDFYSGSHWVGASEAGVIEAPVANEFFVLRNGSKSTLAMYKEGEKAYQRLDKCSAYGVSPRNAEQTFALQALLDDGLPLVTLAGKAGTGKTLLALAAALERSGVYRQVLLARPIIPLSNRDLGFLPGDIDAKLEPYMQPLYDNLGVIQHQFANTDPRALTIRSMLEKDKLLITPLSYIRGRSLQNVFFIVDEAQNLTPHEMKTIITRAGAGTKVVLTGDVHQIDHPYLDALSNGLSYLINKMKGQNLYAHITLERGERSALADLASEVL